MIFTLIALSPLREELSMPRSRENFKRNTSSMKQKNIDKKLIVILGPTTSGKSKLAIKLAKNFNGEIVSADSRQVYKEMDIGTGKISKKEMENVPHHLIDIINPDQEFNVAIYKNLAIKKIKEVQKRGNLPFLVGGTGLYIQAIVDNMKFPKVLPDNELRKELEQKSEKELFKIYKKLDPEGAKVIDKKNKRRLIRAIEVCKVTKKPYSKQRTKGKPLFDVLQIGVKLSKKELEKNISKRVDKMFKLGLEKEVKTLAKKYTFNIPPMKTIGYQEWAPFFETKKGKNYSPTLSLKDKEKIKQEIILHTLQFAKRQMTWFNHQIDDFTAQNFSEKKFDEFKRDSRINWVKNKKEAEKLIRDFLNK